MLAEGRRPVTFAVEPKRACCIPHLSHDYPGTPARLPQESVFASRPILGRWQHKLSQHAKYDVNVLSNAGVAVRGVAHDDAQILRAAFDLAARHGRRPGACSVRDDPLRDVAGKGRQARSFLSRSATSTPAGAAEDADVTLRLHLSTVAKFDHEPARAVYEAIEMPLVPVNTRACGAAWR